MDKKYPGFVYGEYNSISDIEELFQKISKPLFARIKPERLIESHSEKCNKLEFDRSKYEGENFISPFESGLEPPCIYRIGDTPNMFILFDFLNSAEYLEEFKEIPTFLDAFPNINYVKDHVEKFNSSFSANLSNLIASPELQSFYKIHSRLCVLLGMTECNKILSGIISPKQISCYDATESERKDDSGRIEYFQTYVSPDFARRLVLSAKNLYEEYLSEMSYQ